MSPSERQNILDWLAKEGFPLEMRTARTFLNRGWALHHSRMYEDPNTGTDREIDIVAINRGKMGEVNANLEGHFVIECKWSGDKPWVLFMAAKNVFTPWGLLMSSPATTGALSWLHELSAKDIAKLTLFRDVEEGYMLRQAHRSGTDDAYAAGFATTSASRAFAAKLNPLPRSAGVGVSTGIRYRPKKVASSAAPFHIMFFPVIVLAGKLVRCELDDQGDPNISEIKRGCLVHRTSTHVSLVHVVTEGALDDFITRAEETMVAIRKKAAF